MKNRGFFLFCLLLVAGLALLAWRYPYVLGRQEMPMRLLYAALLLVLIGPSLFSRYGRRGGLWLQHLAVWAGVVLLLLTAHAYRHELAQSRLVASLLPSQTRLLEGGAMEVVMAQDGHFYIEADIGGVAVEFMVDTGASDIVLSPDDARRLGFAPETLDYTRAYATANGYGRGAPVTLPSFRVGNVEASSIEASVNDAEMEHSLLGMRFFRLLSGFTVQGDRLILRP